MEPVKEDRRFSRGIVPVLVVVAVVVLVPLDMLPGTAGPKDTGAMGVAGAEAEAVMVVAVEVVEEQPTTAAAAAGAALAGERS